MKTRLITAIVAIGGLICVSLPAEPSGALDPGTAELLDELIPGLNARAANAAALTSAPPAQASDPALRDSGSVLSTTNLLPSALPPHSAARGPEGLEWQTRLEIARSQRLQRIYNEATSNLVAILVRDTPVDLKRTALLELAIIAQEENELGRAQQIFAHYLAKWPDDVSAPEVILRQGLIFRQMGLNHLALTKFYAVMTSSLVLKADKLEYYQRLVLQAQTEIAETYYQQGKFQESAEFFARLLKLSAPALNKPQVHFKLIRSLSRMESAGEVVVKANDFLDRYPEAAEQAEIRFHLASAYKKLGRTGDSLHQVGLLLREQKAVAQLNPQTWSYWQQRTGNEIANLLYREGDYVRALEIYTALARLNGAVDWQLPVWYQIGLTYERLQQPVRALERYRDILNREKEVTTNAAPGLRTILDMARWRQNYLGWQTNAETVVMSFQTSRPITAEAGSTKP